MVIKINSEILCPVILASMIIYLRQDELFYTKS